MLQGSFFQCRLGVPDGSVNLRLKIYFFISALFLANDDTNQKKDPNSTYTLYL